MNWEVRLTRKAEKDLLAIRGPDHARIAERLLDSELQPRPLAACKLTGSAFYRLRIGDWRAIYEIDDAQRRVWIARLLRRSEKTYRGF